MGILVLVGCSAKNQEKTVETSDSTITTTSNSIEVEKDNSIETTSTKYYALYTGEEVSKEITEKPAYMVSIENSSAARPQAGFTSADIVYELMAEGGVTRCVALFQSESADKIGPIRSMRTYFIDLAYEYNVPFAHCGGSHDALDRIKNEKPMSLNEMYNSSYFFRDTSIKVQEHSLFATSEKLVALTESKNYIKPSNVKIEFDKLFWDNSIFENANSVSILFNKYYNTNYTYKDGLYYKSMNNEPCLNRTDNVPVAVNNLVIQNVTYRSRTGELYLDADLVGQGDGIIFSNGKKINVKWSKADLNSQTIFKDEDGNVVPLNIGKTWWHILDQNAKLTVN
ncbi:Protein of unknown function [Clostridium grantii DSM 8605]|uniref:Lipoprotein YerB n=2 Tax=Clostridium TaxID=1485 RepID=A0A1M5VRH2_9CLOT|nr:Protein of unknown function [Clostridium grantii DSM 8605]